MSVFKTGDKSKPKLIFMAASGTVSPIYDFRLLQKRNVMNNCYVREAETVIKNTEIVEGGGTIGCPVLMFISDGKQVSSNWINNEKRFAKLISAETIFLSCGHYVHYYESDRISRKIKEYVAQIKG